MAIRVILGRGCPHIGFTVSALLLLLLLTVMVLATGTSAAAAEPERQSLPSPSSSDRYAINLHSQRTPITDVPELAAEPLKKYRRYQTQGILQGQVWYRLRLGFFTSSRAAEAVKQQLADVYPAAWVTRVATAEWQAHRSEQPAPSPAPPPIATVAPKPVPPGPAVAPIPVPPGPAAAPIPVPPGPATAPIAVSPLPSQPEAPSGEDQELPGLMSEAEQAIIDEDYVNAITLLSKILGRPEHADSQRALELFGLALELSGRGLEQADIEYAKYLKRYPQGEGADRVRERLAALTAPPQPSKKTAKLKKTAATPGWSLGANVGYSFYNLGSDSAVFESLDEGSIISASIDDDVGWKIFANYRFNRHFALEASYIDLGKIDISAESDGSDFFIAGPVALTGNVNGLAVSGSVIFPISEQLELTTKLGIYHWDIVRKFKDIDDSFPDKNSGESALIGVGINFKIDRWGIRAELEHFDRILEDIEVSMLSLGFQYHF